MNAPEGLEIYCDSAWSKAHYDGGCSAVCQKRDCITTCTAKYLEFCNSVLDAEVNGIVLGLKLALANNFARVVLHSDSTEAIWAFQSGVTNVATLLPLIREGSQILKNNLQWSLGHVYRENNISSDMLAKKARMNRWSW